MCALSQKLDALIKEFQIVAENTDESQNHLWGDICLIQVHN
jgi:hypothetical protein